MTRSKSPCGSHRYGDWEKRDAYDERLKKPIPVRIKFCRNCDAFKVEGE